MVCLPFLSVRVPPTYPHLPHPSFALTLVLSLVWHQTASRRRLSKKFRKLSDPVCIRFRTRTLVHLVMIKGTSPMSALRRDEHPFIVSLSSTDPKASANYIHQRFQQHLQYICFVMFAQAPTNTDVACM